MIECIGKVITKNGDVKIARYTLEYNLPFDLREMEVWIKEGDKDNISEVKCYKTMKACLSSWIRRLQN